MRKDTCTPGIPVQRRFRTPLFSLMVILAFLVGGMTSAPNRPQATFAAESVRSTPAVKPTYSSAEEKTKGKVERGQPRRTVRTSVGNPHHIGRPLSPVSGAGVTSDAAPAPGDPTPGSTTKAASRPDSIPVLHCVFRC
ncbi:hypothetical protein SLV14_007127 [Streptomyces sp. Je 1-4]|uniref:hypothetical protein n=1 Tax=Streptomyces TaxID=1883 RepID=UPI00140F092B|nr:MULTISPECIES: hypothetical protein [unclassified Streptomyces]QIK10293.1 hypothetical protein G7Z12_33800 [Streptomyces sp. ID38640]UYB44068.1 hypothetical protein SLV14_007127 [Streptomyces sp. Je 1-4]UZQ40503.1 hypothetical protein SLV14N_007127 [Streptomyces sp. Je 1-4] [Streptomyces sp. Je 1-4 4N24]UZQ47920.1 hypothetical protein SLV14NA_007127 [Streptomyces sp. Je 1-4] [Streptomyces sp. Je 1-4 4N24_ara]